MKNLVIPFLFIFISTASYSQSKNQTEKMKTILKEYNELYLGKDSTNNYIGWEELKDRRKRAAAKYKSLKNIFESKYPILNRLIEHMNSSLESNPDPYKICISLEKALKGYHDIRKKGGAYSRAKYQDYLNIYGINIAAIEKYYFSERCKEFGIIKNIDCSKFNATEQEQIQNQEKLPQLDSSPNIEENNNPPQSPIINIVNSDGGKLSITDTKAVYAGPNNINYSARNAILLLRELINTGVLNNDHLELQMVMPTDSRNILAGTPYEVTFKHDDTKKVIHFPAGKFIISDENEEVIWDEYQNGVRDLTQTVIFILKKFGGSSFEILFQGSADKPTFTPKQLPFGYDTDFFQNIKCVDVTKINGMEIGEQTIKIGSTYTNDELPQLRAAFLKYSLFKMDTLNEFEHKLHILKGSVKDYINVDKRNATIIIFIDWDTALKHADKLDKGEAF